jgi:hypothetical protein
MRSTGLTPRSEVPCIRNKCRQRLWLKDRAFALVIAVLSQLALRCRDWIPRCLASAARHTIEFLENFDELPAYGYLDRRLCSASHIYAVKNPNNLGARRAGGLDKYGI